jgi:hypothetical protein
LFRGTLLRVGARRVVRRSVLVRVAPGRLPKNVVDNLARGMEAARHLGAQKPALAKAADRYLASAKHAAR